MNTVLIIDDDKELCALIKHSVLSENIEADCCNTGKEGLMKLKEKDYQLVIVGQNGTGKSTLIKICTEKIIPDHGRIIWQPDITIGYLDQYAEIDRTVTMKDFLKSAFAKLFEMEAQTIQLYEKAAEGDLRSMELAARYQEQLETHDFYSIDTAIERVANGLGLLAIGLERSIAEMSGGQRLLAEFDAI